MAKSISIYKDIDIFTTAYLEAALWSSTDESTPEGGEPLDDNYGIDNIAQKSLRIMRRECREFQRSAAQLLAQAYAATNSKGEKFYDEENAGHDFWLTRNGHGAGFWDRGLGDIGKALTDCAKSESSRDLYVWRKKVFQY